MLYEKIDSREELLQARNHMCDVLKTLGFNPSEENKKNEVVAKLLGAKDWNTASAAVSRGQVSASSSTPVLLGGFSTLEIRRMNEEGWGFEVGATGLELAVKDKSSFTPHYDTIQDLWDALSAQAARELHDQGEIGFCGRVLDILSESPCFKKHYGQKPVTLKLNIERTISHFGDKLRKDDLRLELGAMKFKVENKAHPFAADEVEIYAAASDINNCYRNILSIATNLYDMGEETTILHDSFRYGLDLELDRETVKALQVEDFAAQMEQAGWTVTNEDEEYLDLLYCQKVKDLGDGDFRDIEVLMTLNLQTFMKQSDWRKTIQLTASLNDGDGSFGCVSLSLAGDKLDTVNSPDFDAEGFTMQDMKDFKLDEAINKAMLLADDTFL